MVADDYIKAKLVEVAWHVAGHISFPACVAVMFCVRNQFEKNADKDWLRVIESAPRGFREGFVRKQATVDVRNPDFQNLLGVVDAVFDGSKTDNLTNGATSWQEDEGKERVAVIGGLVLFK